MSLDDRIDEAWQEMFGIEAGPKNKEVMKQLLSDVLAYVIPERARIDEHDGPTPEHLLTAGQINAFNSAIVQMKANIKELGLGRSER